MSNYTKTTDFAAKDSLPSGDSGKIIRGSEFETEFDNIATAVATKADTAGPTFTGTVTLADVTVTGNTTLGSDAADTVTVTADVASDLIPSADGIYDLGAVGSEWQDLYVTGTANVDSLVADTVTISGGTITATLTGNVTGDLTGTVLTAAQPNITSVGTLTSASISGDLAVDTDTLFVDVSAGRVGIGTSSPSNLLHVAGASAGTLELARFRLEGATNNPMLKIEADEANATAGLDTSGSVAADMTFSVAGVERARIDTSGNLGIGTSSPTFLLDVAGNARASYFALRSNETAPSESAFIYRPATGVLGLGTATVERMRIDQSGNVGIGVTSPTAKLHVAGTIQSQSGSSVAQMYSDGSAAYFTSVGAFPSIFSTNGIERLRIDSSGNVGIGTAGPTSRLHITGAATGLTLEGTTRADLFLVDSGAPTDQKRKTIRSFDGDLIFGTENDAINDFAEAMRIDSDGNVGIGTLSPGRPLDISTAGSTFARISSTASGGSYSEIAHGSVQGNLLLSADAGNNLSGSYIQMSVDGSERMRIDSNGNLLVGTTASDNDGLSIKPRVSGSGTTTQLLFNRANTTAAGFALVFQNNSTVVGSITHTDSSTAFNTSSDVRLKENITDAPEGNIDQLQVRSFDWKVNGEHQEYGFIAQELETVAPYAVTKGETEDDMWSVDYSKLVPMLVKEIQQLKAEVAALKGTN